MPSQCGYSIMSPSVERCGIRRQNTIYRKQINCMQTVNIRQHINGIIVCGIERFSTYSDTLY